MITARLTHPEMIAALAAAGHGSTVLLTDGHYPAKTAVGPNTQTVHLNLTAGTPSVPEVLSVVLDTIPVEHATLISPSADALPSAVQEEILQLLPDPVPIAYVAGTTSTPWRASPIWLCAWSPATTAGSLTCYSRLVSFVAVRPGHSCRYRFHSSCEGWDSCLSAPTPARWGVDFVPSGGAIFLSPPGDRVVRMRVTRGTSPSTNHGLGRAGREADAGGSCLMRPN
ncbi:D-ribose pyranase 2 [Arthrobacter sp. Hiyo6]|nr:D-ribose pyranase 2 [Arthrobacter sp. Hiyo6]